MYKRNLVAEGWSVREGLLKASSEAVKWKDSGLIKLL